MNNKLIIGALLFLPASLCMAQDKFEISGKLSAAETDRMVVLNYINSAGKDAKDSAIVKNGKFTLNGTTSFGNKAYLSLVPVKKESTERRRSSDDQLFYLEKGNYKVTGKDSIATASITGAQVQTDFLNYNAQTKSLLSQFKEITQRFTKVWYAKVKDTVAIKAIQAEARPVNAKIEKALDSFIYSHPNSYLTVDLIADNKTAVIDPETFEPYYRILSPRVLASVNGQKLTAKYNKAKLFGKGKTIDFTLPDKNGTEFKLSSLKGKYVLVDFWASWCVPCRAENPFLLKAYNELRDKNFEIVSVSLDDKRQNWLQAVESDKLPWTQVSDVKGFKTEIAVRFGINAIPQNVLLDPDGKVIAKDLRGADVNKKIASYIK